MEDAHRQADASKADASRADVAKADVPKRLLGALLDEMLVSAVLSFFSVGTLGLVYFIGQDCIAGQSVGRRLVKQRLIDIETGEVVAPVKAAMRNLVGFLVAVTTVGVGVDLVLIVVRQDGRRICDLLFGTQVVDVEHAAAEPALGLAPTAPLAGPPTAPPFSSTGAVVETF